MFLAITFVVILLLGWGAIAPRSQRRAVRILTYRPAPIDLDYVHYGLYRLTCLLGAIALLALSAVLWGLTERAWNAGNDWFRQRGIQSTHQREQSTELAHQLGFASVGVRDAAGLPTRLLDSTDVVFGPRGYAPVNPDNRSPHQLWDLESTIDESADLVVITNDVCRIDVYVSETATTVDVGIVYDPRDSQVGNDRAALAKACTAGKSGTLWVIDLDRPVGNRQVRDLQSHQPLRRYW